jgi:beta-glucosidase/6-phospho-beta-glucosidase/beta-galactosidase
MIELIKTIEDWTLPLPDTIHWAKGQLLQDKEFSLSQKISYYALNIIRLLSAWIALPFVFFYSTIVGLCSKPEGSISWTPSESTAGDFAAILPNHIGYAGSLFQDSGIGSKYSATPGLESPCQWDSYLTPEHIDGTTKEDFENFFIDILKDPDPFVQMLSDMGSTAYRFSLEWSVIQKTYGGKYEEEKIGLYRTFIQKLLSKNITPYVTLHHFTHPQWFETMGAFKTQQNIEIYQKYALDMIDLFPEVTYWYTFNEAGAFTLECFLKDHPSQINDLTEAGQMLRNLLMAHCKIYKTAKKRHPEKQFGITHQWLKLSGVNDNFLEKIICYLISKLTHWSIYQFFKTGNFSFEIPFQSNHHFMIPQKTFVKNNGFLDHIGFQFYGSAQIIIGANGGEAFPGHRISNFCWESLGFSAGGTCKKGQSIMSFGPTVSPETLYENLQEAAALGHPIHISEIGCDAKIQKHGTPFFVIDEENQKKTFQRYASILKNFKQQITAFFVWTIHGSETIDQDGRLQPAQLEWNRGAQSDLAVCKIKKDSNRKMIGYEPRPSGKWFREAFLLKKHEISNSLKI